MTKQLSIPNHEDLGSGAADGTIISVNCFPLRLPLRKPLVMATSRLNDAPVIYVRIRSRGGAEGWGEAAANLLSTGETTAGMVSLVNRVIAPALIGVSVFARARLSARMRADIFSSGGALAAIDMAMLDLVCHLRGVPLVELLGGAMRGEVRTLSIIGGSGDPEHDVQEALDEYAAGGRAFKLKVGVGSTEEDLRTIRLLREALGPDTFIAADANMAWNVPNAIQFAKAAAPYRLDYLEQPVAPEVARFAAVARASPVAISADESIHGCQDILALVNAQGIGGVSLKAIKLGGITPLVALATVCDSLGLSVGLAMMMESSLATAAMVHAACAVPQIDWGLNLGSLFLAEDPVAEPVASYGGVVRCPPGPGIGVKIDERRLAKFIDR